MKTRASSFSTFNTDKRPNSHLKRGFTIVELLIVIVVIAILAAITIVAYNGVQQRANNTAIIDAVSKTSRMVQAYIATNGTYPTTSGGCITATSGCQVNGSIVGTSSTFDTAMATVGSLPRSIPMGSSTNQSGILYSYSSTRTYEGSVQPSLLFYWLYGVGQSCGVSGVTSASWTAAVASTTGYTAANDNGTGKTLCYITIPGPSV